MTFALSAQNVRLDDGHILRCDLKNGEGNFVPAELDLNNCLGNDWGNFQWGGNGFQGSCQNASFSLEGADSVPILRAQLDDGNGNHVDRDINLGERLSNNNGQLVFN